jgi:Carboxypeptidase regulatory-like domain
MGGELEMARKAAKSILGGMILILSLLHSAPVRAQIASATLSGTITDPSGNAVPNATVSAKKGLAGQAVEAQTDSAGHYKVSNLTPGEYEVSVSAAGFSTSVVKVTITQAAQQTMNLTLSEALSLGNLGFSPAQTRGNTKEQARLDKRSHMLQMHQRLGLITTGPLVATVILGAFAGGKATSSTDRDLHAALGSATVGLYAATAYYAIFAPKIPGTKVQGNIRLHKAMAWIHGPGMILTPILGEMAFSQKSRGEKVHGIAQYHSDVAIVTAAAYGVAILSVTLKSGSVSRSARHVAAVLGLRHSHSEDTIVEDNTSANP